MHLDRLRSSARRAILTRSDTESWKTFLVEDILHLSQLVTDVSEIAEIDINPLLVRPEGGGTVALDARIRLVRNSDPSS